jgi:hypothetical protein
MWIEDLGIDGIGGENDSAVRRETVGAAMPTFYFGRNLTDLKRRR